MNYTLPIPKVHKVKYFFIISWTIYPLNLDDLIPFKTFTRFIGIFSLIYIYTDVSLMNSNV